MKLDLTDPAKLTGHRPDALAKLQLTFPGAIFNVEVPDTTGEVFDGWAAGLVQFSIETTGVIRPDITFDELLQVALFMGTPTFSISYWRFEFDEDFGTDKAGWIFTCKAEDWK